ncbi:uncharacterized protein PAC_00626 [Phialocephala subalpina]|uniref:ATP-grasp domain-containing protein n=1 Tax=Phialocephala subalpina TaxID=576137 RepID=A0A1L7WD93_9HELO|nr:uncharacterized protein PAC_00626 [Phialocephala subalpina]
MSSTAPEPIRIAVLHQAIEPPIINGVHKPMKPGGYQDSGADIAYSLQSLSDVKILTPSPLPNPHSSTGWTFPDTPSGILSAVQAGATHLWANTILFSSHPLQTLQDLDKQQDEIRVIGQPPNLVQLYDNKEYVNSLLRSHHFTLPKSWTLTSSPTLDLSSTIKKLGLTYPIVGKPIRGRGSSGVKLCHNPSELLSHIQSLFLTSPTIMLEQHLSGEECTVTVMPPSHQDYWALPVVRRFNHEDGIAPYNGVVAVTTNSRVVTKEEREKDRYLSGEECTVTVMPPSHQDYWALPVVRRFNHEDGIAPYNGVVAVTTNSRVVTKEEREKDRYYGRL